MTEFPTALCAIAGVLFVSAAGAQSRTFENPLQEGVPVDYCGAAAGSCGEQVATAWCEARGYENATDWAARAGVDAASRSVRLDDGSVCQGAACESFAAITCSGAKAAITAPRLGADGRATVIAPGQRATEVSLDQDDLELLMPGCVQRVSGVFVCDSIIEYEHCRSLMISRMVFSCRIEMPFAGESVEPHAAQAGEYRLQVDSDAEVRVNRGSRGFGQVKGKAEVELAFPWPQGSDDVACIERVSRIYWMTGPEGGTAESGEAEPCDEPITFSFEPHKDDLMRAYDLCDSFAAWGDGLQDSIDVLAAGLFAVGSSASAPPRRGAVFAPFVIVEAPLAIDCRD